MHLPWKMSQLGSTSIKVSVRIHIPLLFLYLCVSDDLPSHLLFKVNLGNEDNLLQLQRKSCKLYNN